MMELVLFYFFIAIFGLIIGSFLNVVIYRSVHPSDKSRSFCPECQHTLSAQDLIPVVSFLLLKGHCRYCKKPISSRYIVVEISTAMVFVLTSFLVAHSPALGASFTMSLVYFLLVSSILTGLIYSDLYYGILPHNFIIFGLVVTSVYVGFFAPQSGISLFLSGVSAGLSLGGFFFLLILITNGAGMGGGDVKFGFWLGLMLGWPLILVGAFLAFLTGSLLSVMLILLRVKKFGQTIPFGPFLALGGFIALFWGNQILNWYIGISAR